MLAAIAVAGALVFSGCNDQGSAADFQTVQPDTLTVATEGFPVAGFWEGTATHPTGGFEYELARDLQEHFGLAHLKIVVVPFAKIVSGDLGDADLALSLVTPTDEREQLLDFSAPYLDSPAALLTPSDIDVPDLDTARDLQYVVETGTTLQTALSDHIDPIAEPIIAPDRQAVIAALADGRADAAIFDLPAAEALAQQSNGQLHVAAKLEGPETIAAALPDGEESNREAVSSAIRSLDADGTLADLSRRWLGDEVTDGALDVPLLRSTR